MKTKLIFITFLVAVISFSCKNESKKTEEILPEEKIITFDVTTDVIVKKDDDLIIYYKDGTNEWFDERHAVWNHVKGSDNLQTITFHLPEGVLPNNIRFDFSKNPLQDPIKISRIKISYQKNSFEVREDDILNYFEINEYVKYDKNTKLYTTSKDSKGVYDPFLQITMKFYNEMDKVNKN